MKLHAITGLGRHIDLSLRSNQIVILGAGVIGAVAFALTWIVGGSPDLFLSGSVAAGAFVAWAVARELDPDNTQTATRAIFIAGLLAIFGLPALIAVAVILLTVRILAGTVGAPLRATDLLVLVATVGFAGSQPLAWPAVLALIYAVWIRKPERYQIATGAMVAAGVAVASISGASPEPGLPGVAGSLMLAAVLIAGSSRARAGFIRSRTDDGASLVDPTDVSLARRAALFAVVGGSFLMAPEAVGLAPVMAAILSVAMTREIDESYWAEADHGREGLTSRAVSVPAKPHAHRAGNIPPVY